MHVTISFLHTESILTYKTNKFVKFLHGGMRDSLLALSTMFQTDFKMRLCNKETVELTFWRGDETQGRQEKRFCVS